MVIAKYFKWEAAHRIPWHEGKCKHLHGHSYKMFVELEGSVNANGIVIDFDEVKTIIDPFIQKFDHTTLISKSDNELRQVFDKQNWKYYLLPYDSTAENICNFFLEQLITQHSTTFISKNITSIGIKVFETDTAYAYTKKDILR